MSWESWKATKHFCLVHTNGIQPALPQPAGWERAHLFSQAAKSWGRTAIGPECCAPEPLRCWPASLVEHKAEPILWCWDLAARDAAAQKEKLTCSGAEVSLFWRASSYFKHLPVVQTFSLSWEDNPCCQSHESYWEAQPERDTQYCSSKREPKVLLQA